MRGRDGVTCKPRTTNRYKAVWFGAVIVAALGVLAMADKAAAQSPNMSGSIFMATQDGAVVNENTRFPGKAAVYLNGGPQNHNATGLPDGNYAS